MKRVILHSQSLLFVIMTVAVASSISLIGGFSVEAFSESILPIVPLVIALPTLNTMVGDYAAIIASHYGNQLLTKSEKSKLARAILISIVVNVLLTWGLSLALAWMRDYPIDFLFVGKYLLFVAASVSIVVSLIIFITSALNAIMVKHRLNPDDILIPVVTSITDIAMLTLIALAAIYVF